MKHYYNFCECGRLALFFSKKRHKYRANVNHHLCFRCFKTMLQKENLYGNSVPQRQELPRLGA